MQSVKIGAPTFILREQAQRDLFAVFDGLKAIGCDGVELLGFFGRDPGDIRKKLDDIGLEAMGDHVDIASFLADPDRVIDDHLRVGCSYLTISHGEGQFLPGAAAFGAMLEDMRLLIGKCLAAGITPHYHNHGWDARGESSYIHALMDGLRADGLRLEPDLGWMVYAGADPAAYLRKYADCCPVLHLKDVYADDYAKAVNKPGDVRRDPDNGGFEFRPTGYGTVNFPALMPLMEACRPEWLIVDHDLAYGRDSYGDLKLSVDYLRALIMLSSETAVSDD